ncbi:MAG: type II toxin-antitoxin system VapC family toxin [bacterium]|nr:type II toxin-antitoxin system VapC family toxin [bacterium]
MDTSALLAYIEDEDGANEVDHVLNDAMDERHTVYISLVSSIEVFYISLQEQGQIIADERLQLLKDLPLVHEPLDEELVTMIGTLKAAHRLSFADCCIAGLAQYKDAILMHKDPEFAQLRDIAQHTLPYNTHTP